MCACEGSNVASHEALRLGTQGSPLTSTERHEFGLSIRIGPLQQFRHRIRPWLRMPDVGTRGQFGGMRGEEAYHGIALWACGSSSISTRGGSSCRLLGLFEPPWFVGRRRNVSDVAVDW